MLICGFVFCLILSSSNGLIPDQCTQNATSSKVCCPLHPITKTVCGFPRGICAQVELPAENVPLIFQIDDRIKWPSKFFTVLCACRGNFFGVACEECLYGWEGISCSRRRILLRRNVLSLNFQEKELLHRVLQLSLEIDSHYVIPVEMDNQLSDPLVNPIWLSGSVQYNQVFDHKYASRSTLFSSEEDCASFGKVLDFNHNGVSFPLWHRYFMMRWERYLGRIAQKFFGVSGFALPYWDWTDMTHCDVCSDDILGSEGVEDDFGTRLSINSRFYNWTEFCPELITNSFCTGCHASDMIGRLNRKWISLEFPVLEDIYFTLQQQRFYSVETEPCDSLAKALEGECGRPEDHSQYGYMHNKIHNMMDGSMCCAATSPNDPLFILHHVQIDRIFQAWFLRHRPVASEYPVLGEKPGMHRSSYLVGFIPLVMHGDLFTNTINLGYTYDNYDFTLNRRRQKLGL